VNDAFRQADDLGVSVCEARNYIRSQGFYDYFSTVVLYDALWISPYVRQVHDTLYRARTGYEMREAARSDSAEFYVLLGPQAGKLLLSPADETAQWSIILGTHNQVYQPIILERIDPDPDYVYILGDHITQFRDVYRVVFDVQPDSHMDLILQSPEHRVVLQWC
jgi:hypothetical protein